MTALAKAPSPWQEHSAKEAQSLQWFLSESRLYPQEVNERRLDVMVADVPSPPGEEGILVIDEHSETEKDPGPRNREGKKECFSRVLAAGFDNSEGMAGTLCHAQKILEGVLSGMPPPP